VHHVVQRRDRAIVVGDERVVGPGAGGVRDGAEIKREIEADYAAVLGAERLAELRASLKTLLGDR
jgi:hypothetical protein